MTKLFASPDQKNDEDQRVISVYYSAPAQGRRISAVWLLALGKEKQYFDLGDDQDIKWR